MTVHFNKLVQLGKCVLLVLVPVNSLHQQHTCQQCPCNKITAVSLITNIAVLLKLSRSPIKWAKTSLQMYTKDANKHLCQSSSFKRRYIHMLYIDVSTVVASDTKVLLPTCDLGHNISIVLKKMQCSAGYIMHMHYCQWCNVQPVKGNMDYWNNIRRPKLN